MRFSKLVILSLLAVAAAACTKVPARFTVHGTISDPVATMAGSKVYLLGANGPIDSVSVVDGTFSFTGRINKQVSLAVFLKFPGRDRFDERFTVRFVPDAKDITIDLDYPVTVTGSPLSDANAQLLDGIMELYYERESEIGELALSGNEAAADSIYALQMQKIHELCRQTYIDHSEDIVGLQAFSMLINDLPYDELAALLEQGSDFIKEDPGIIALMEEKKEEDSNR